MARSKKRIKISGIGKKINDIKEIDPVKNPRGFLNCQHNFDDLKVGEDFFSAVIGKLYDISYALPEESKNRLHRITVQVVPTPVDEFDTNDLAEIKIAELGILKEDGIIKNFRLEHRYIKNEPVEISLLPPEIYVDQPNEALFADINYYPKIVIDFCRMIYRFKSTKYYYSGKK